MEGVPQRIHVALPHYAAVRRRAALKQKGAPQTDTGATMPAKSGCGNGGGGVYTTIIPLLLTRASWAFDIISLLKSR